MNTLIETQNLTKRYHIGKKRAVQAVDGVSLSIARGEIFGLVGESGCGKSTFGRLLLRLIEPTGGSVKFDGSDINVLAPRELSKLRRGMQMVFQDPYGSFNPKMRLGASLSEVGAYFGLSRRETRERIAELLNCVNLSEDVLMRTPRELSGGQLQRLAIARALFMKPVFAVADEPVSALDVSVSAQLLNLLYDLRETAGLTMLFISHDILAVKYLCDRVAVMYLGSIVEVCDAADLFDKALHPYTRALLASAPALGAKLTSAIKGDTLDTQHGAQTEGCRFYARCTVRADVCLTQKPALKPISENHCAACHMCGENRAYNI